MSLINIYYYLFLGFFYFKECCDFMKKRELLPLVSVSEDGTRVITRIEYDYKTNQMVGFVAPYDKNGQPKKLFFPASSARQMVKYFMNERKAVNALVVMVQPLSDGNKFFFLFFIEKSDIFFNLSFR